MCVCSICDVGRHVGDRGEHVGNRGDRGDRV